MDVETIIVISALSHVLQILVLLFQFAVGRSYRGVGWWVLWSAAEAGGFLAMLLRGESRLGVTAILVQNILLMLGVSFLYIGLMRFHGRPDRRKLLAVAMGAFAFVHAYFLLARPVPQMRAIAFAAALSLILLLTARDLVSFGFPSTRASRYFLALLLAVSGTYFGWRAGRLVAGSAGTEFLDSSLFNVSQFLLGFSLGNLLAFGLVIMINQRSHAEAVEAREHFESLFDLIPDTVVITRLSDGVCTHVNSGFEAATGLGRNEVLGRSTLDLGIYGSPGDRAAVVRELGQKGAVASFEIPYRLKTGEVRSGSVSARTVDLLGQPHVISVVRDVTGQKRIAEALERDAMQIAELNTSLERRVAERTAALQAANKELQVVIRSLAHDFRAPLRALDGYSAILEEEHAPTLGESGVRLIDRLRMAARRIDRLLRDLLDYMETGSRDLECQVIDVGRLARDEFAGVKRGAGLEGFELRTGELPAAWADQDLLRTVLRELLDNAVKFSATTGHREILLDGGTRDGYNVYRVSDRGVGFDSSHAGRLFGLFERLHPPERFEGTGMGLAIVKRVVERHGGWVAAEGVPGEGAIVSFALPEGAGGT